MSDMKHTPEPWQFHEGLLDIVGEYGDAVGRIHPDGGIHDEADGARIVACVNALAGLSDDALAGGWNYAGQNAYALKLERARDELLASLRMTERNLASLIAAGQAREGSGEAYLMTPWLDEVRASLAKHGAL